CGRAGARRGDGGGVRGRAGGRTSSDQPHRPPRPLPRGRRSLARRRGPLPRRRSRPRPTRRHLPPHERRAVLTMRVHLAVLQELITRIVPDREAIVWRDGVLDYAGFLGRCRQMGHAFRTLGLGCHTERSQLEPWESGQDHVAVCMYNCPEWLEVMFGSYHARAVMVNVNYRYKAEELRYVLANSRARALVYQAAFAPLVAEASAGLPELRHLIQLRDDSDNARLPGALDYE